MLIKHAIKIKRNLLWFDSKCWMGKKWWIKMRYSRSNDLSHLLLASPIWMNQLLFPAIRVQAWSAASSARSFGQRLTLSTFSTQSSNSSTSGVLATSQFASTVSANSSSKKIFCSWFGTVRFIIGKSRYQTQLAWFRKTKYHTSPHHILPPSLLHQF